MNVKLSGIFNFSEQYNCEKLKAEARQVMKLGFSVICLKEEFLQLSAARLEEMLSWSDVKLGEYFWCSAVILKAAIYNIHCHFKSKLVPS